MTDAEIRQWCSDMEEGRDFTVITPDDLCPLLKELLAHRSLKFTGWWRVWCPDPTPNGWRPMAAFADKDDAEQYRSAMGGVLLLVLPWNEEPSLTAR